MNARLISHSIPNKITGLDDCQELVAYCARVSNPGNQNNKGTSEKLIKYLIKHKHWSPLEMERHCAADITPSLVLVSRVQSTIC